MKWNATKILVLIWALGLLFSATPLRAQVTGATLSGTITDSQGGAVVGAKVSAKNGATGVTTESTTNASGAYSIVNLIPADYEVSVASSGFRTTISKVTLTVGAKQELSVALTVGDVSQTVEVTGAAPIVETTNATLSGNVESAQIVELPLNGRDWVQLASLQPGVAEVRPHEAVDAPGGSTRGLGIQMTVNGARPQQNVYRLNGVIVNDYSNAGPGNVLGANAGVDAIQEFSVLTSNYSAEYGYTSGGVINAITKSGTNSFHGSVYEFVRNSAFDAADFFENANGEKKGGFTRNQFGASAGWKILKDKAFLFGDYEGLRQVKAVPQSGATLTSLARLGVVNDNNGVPFAPLPAGPCTVVVNVKGKLTNTGVPMANATRLDPNAAVCVDNTIFKLINPAGSPAGGLMPLPNGPVNINAGGNTGSIFTDGGQRASDNYGTVRGDFKLSDKDSLAASWYRDTSTWIRPNVFNDTLTGFEVPHSAYSLEESHIFSSAMVNTIRLGLNESFLYSPSFSDSNPLSHDTTLGIMAGCVAPGFSIGGNGNSGNSVPINGGSGFTGAPSFSARTKKIEVFDDLARTFGNHSLKLGFMYVGDHQNWIQGPAGCGGSASFSDITDFLQNIVHTVRMPVIEPFVPPATVHHYRSKIIAGYVQDDWKLRSNLSVNLGLRYEMSTIPTEVDGKINYLENIWQNPGPCVANSQGIGQCAGFFHQTFQHNPTLKNFEPRIGFAWDPFHDGKTSVRGGIGMFDVLPLSYMFALNSLQTAPNGAEIDLKFSTGAVTNGVVTKQPTGQGHYPTGFVADTNGPNASIGGAAARWSYVEPNPKRNDVVQYNLNIQRQVTTTMSVTLAYAGSRAWHNPFQTDDLNTVFPYKTSAGWLFPNPVNGGCLPGPPDCSQTDVALGLPSTFSDNPTGIIPGLLINSHVAQIQSTIFQAQSWYNSMQLRVDKRMSHGFQVGGSFTWGKSFDTTSSSFAGDNYSNNPSAIVPWWDQGAIKGLSDFNVTKNLVINALWQIPTPASWSGAVGWIAKGWGVGGVFEASDGTPLWPLSGFDADTLGMLNGGPYDIPDYVPGCQLTNPSSGRHGALQYINPACFTIPVAPNAAYYNAPAPLGCDQAATAAYLAVNPAGSPLSCFNLMGHLGRNTVIGPGLINTDMSLTKDTRIRKLGENFNVQFRAEFFNIMNRTNFAPPTASNPQSLSSLDSNGLTSSGFGVLSRTQVPMREIQFALKLAW
ncbi:MAG: hypothetical protein JWN92_94 [Candidatus Acidoferrum typicum]|nr:hypothetical protein [Candidatus Acidoferrum typicum]